MKQGWHSGSLTAERNRYKEFIEGLARMELVKSYPQHVTTNERWYQECPRCDGPLVYVGTPFTHEGDCPVVEARQLLGLPMDEEKTR